MTNYLYFACPKPNCDNRPFPLTQEQLDAADGEIWCEVCDTLCKQVQPTDQVLTTLGAAPLPGLEVFFDDKR